MQRLKLVLGAAAGGVHQQRRILFDGIRRRPCGGVRRVRTRGNARQRIAAADQLVRQVEQVARSVFIGERLGNAVRVLENPLLDVFPRNHDDVVAVIAVRNHGLQLLDVCRVRADRAVRAHPNHGVPVAVVAHGVRLNRRIDRDGFCVAVRQAVEAVGIAPIRISGVVAGQDALHARDDAGVHARFGFFERLCHVAGFRRKPKAVVIVVAAAQVANNDVFVR